MFNTDLQKVQYYDKYARFSPQLGRRETWPETTQRVMGFLQSTVSKRLVNGERDPFDWKLLQNAMLNLEALPSMRITQMAGPALERCNVGAYNCAYLPLQDPQALAELLYILMQGTGVGFSVEHQYIEQWPGVKSQGTIGISGPFKIEGPITHIIEDSTEGWCDAFQIGLGIWLNGGDVEFDYAKIRPYGAPLATKGGRASGPEPLKNLLDFTRTMILRHQGRKLSSLNIHDLACYCGSIVQVGGVRRAAEISLSDLDDEKMKRAKHGQFWQNAPERAMANNSAVYREKPELLSFIGEWTGLIESGTGERGLFNRGGINSQIPQRRAKRDDWGMNPCGEILLRPFEFCNLSIAVARPGDAMADLMIKVDIATQFGIIQSLLTDFNYIRPEWKKNCEQERLLGVDVTGQMDCMLFGEYFRDYTYNELKKTAINTAAAYSAKLDIPLPAAVTCVKPSGNSSQLLNVSSGMHPRFAPYYVRRLRIGAGSAMCKFLMDHGIPHQPENGQHYDTATVWVFEFPVKSPTGARTRHDMTALDQLEQWKSCKINYTEHNPSITVYVKEDEWLTVGGWVQKNWQHIGGISFLPYDGGVYLLPPYEEITETEYHKRVANVPDLPFELLKDYETGDNTEVNREFSCVGDKCEI